MGISVALAFYMDDTIEDFTYTDSENRTRLKQITEEELIVESDDLEACNVVDAYILPEDFGTSSLAQAIRENCVDKGVYQILVFLIDTEDDEDIDEEYLEGVAVNVMDALDAGNLQLIDKTVIALYSYEYNNL